MADAKISALTAQATFETTNEFPLADTGVTKKITGANLAAGVIASDAELAALAGLTSAADKVPYFTGSGAASLADFSSFGRTLVDDADAAAARTTMAVTNGEYAHITGLYYGSPKVSGNVTAFTFTQNTMFFTPFLVSVATTYQAILGWVAASQASNTYRMGIYSEGSGGAPGALVLDAGTIDASSTGQKSITISQLLNPGRYWLAVVEQGGAGGATFFAQWAVNNCLFVAGSANAVGLKSTSTAISGALPDPAGAVSVHDYSGTTVNAPWILLRVS